jgi:hypothetical protein
VREGFELRIARNVIIMCMSVSYDQGLLSRLFLFNHSLI